MSMAVIGAVVAVGGTAYSIYSQERARSEANNLEPRPFHPLNVQNVAAQAKLADIAGYNASDADFARRFPKLVQGRDYNIGEAGKQLGGQISSQATAGLDKAGLSADFGNTEFEKALNLGKPVLSMEQRDRTYFQRLLSENPQRSAGLSGKGVTQLALANTNAQNAYNSQLFGNKIDQYNSNIGQGIANANAAVGGLGSLASLIYDYNNKPPTASSYLSPNQYLNSLSSGYNGPSYPAPTGA